MLLVRGRLVEDIETIIVALYIYIYMCVSCNLYLRHVDLIRDMIYVSRWQAH